MLGIAIITAVLLAAAADATTGIAPFSATWNVPSAPCADLQLPFNPGRFGIATNPGEATYGPTIVLFFTLGKFPRIESAGSAWINGGVPQNGDLGLHLMDAEIDINNLIPDENFDGLAVIDFEDWRPVWSLTGGTQQKYKDVSIDLVRKRHSNWTDRQIEALAKTEYERAGRRFLISTLELGKHMRPRGKWGYYGYPFVDNYDKGVYNVSSTYRKANDELSELFMRSTAIYPSIYVLKDNLTSGERALQVQGRINETFRVRKNTAIPIIPYFWYSYHEVIELLAYEDLESTIGTVYVNGLPGFVIWGGSSEVSSTYNCRRIKNYLDTTLGPYVQGISNQSGLWDPTTLEFPSGIEHVSPAAEDQQGPFLDLAVIETIIEKPSYIEVNLPIAAYPYAWYLIAPFITT